MTTALTTTTDLRALLIPHAADKDGRYRLGRFADWLTATGGTWHDPDLASYRDRLLETYAPGTASAHLSTIRGRYRALLRENGNRAALYDLAGESLRATGQVDDFANRKAYVDELTTRIQNAIDPATAPVKVTVQQDRPDSDFVRLTAEQASALLAAPGVRTRQGLRDTAVIGLMLCCGLREAEVCDLDVGDLRQRLGDELALHVRHGKGDKGRLIPYGALSWVLAIVDAWRERAGIETGPVFRGFFRGGGRLRSGRLSVRAVQYIVGAYPVMIDGELRTVKPHDLRRTYARRLYEAHVDPVAIQQNLGHASLQTTLGYIGELGADKRRPPEVYTFDLYPVLQQMSATARDRDLGQLARKGNGQIAT